jgi:cytochrome c oxidase cbb3-type subunit 4
LDLIAISEALRPYWVVWLMILFGAVLFWVFRPKNRKRFDEAGNIPLNDDD